MIKSNACVKIFGASMLMSACLLSGCATVPNAMPLPAQSKQWKKVALVQEMILPPSLPVVPLVQSGIFRGLASSIEADIVKLHKDRIDGYEEVLGRTLSTNCPFTVVYGKELLKMDAFKNINPATVKTFATTTDGRGVNSMVIPSRGYNFFDFKGKDANPIKVIGMENSFIAAHASSLSALCKSLDVDSIVVASLYVDTPGVNFLAQGQRNLTLTVAFFDRDGKLCHSAKDVMRGNTSTGGDMDAYTKTMDKYPELVLQLVQRLMDIKPAGDVTLPRRLK